jgi:hypothetical protein
LFLANNNQNCPAMPKFAPAKNKQEAKTKCLCSAQCFSLIPLRTSPPRSRKKVGDLDTDHSAWNLAVLLTLALTLTLALAFLSSQKPPDTVLSGSMADIAPHSVETSKKKKSGLSPSLCVLATSRWPNRDRLTVVIPARVAWPHNWPRPSTLNPAVPCMRSTPPSRASRACPSPSS